MIIRIRSVTSAGPVQIVIMIMGGIVLFVRNAIIQMKILCVENAGFVKAAEADFVIPVVFVQSVMKVKVTICIARNARTVTVL